MRWMTTWLGMAFLVAAGLAGCTRVREVMPGQDSNQVWVAMVSAAENPEYPEWFLTENQVDSDPATYTIRLYRTIKRDVRVPLGGTQRQERTMQHEYRLQHEDGELVIEFFRRGWGIGVRSRAEARKYFDSVWELLGGRPVRTTQPMPGPGGEHDDLEAMTEEAGGEEDAAGEGGDDADPIIDLDDLDDDGLDDDGAAALSGSVTSGEMSSEAAARLVALRLVWFNH